MTKTSYLGGALLLACALAACGGPIDTTPLAPPTPAPSPSATATASASPAASPTATPMRGATTVTPATFFFGAIAATQTFAVSETNYTGAFTVSSSNSAVATATVNGSTVTVTAQGDGTATITVSDSFGGSAPIAITVTTAGISI